MSQLHGMEPRMAFASLTADQQYLSLFITHGIHVDGASDRRSVRKWRRRLDALHAFTETIRGFYGHLVVPTDLTPEHFSKVILVWHANGITNEFAERAKVAAWLFDLVVDDYVCPYPVAL